MPEYPSNKVTAISGAGYGSSNGSLTFGGNVQMIVPQDYYYSLTASGATIGTASVLGL